MCLLDCQQNVVALNSPDIHKDDDFIHEAQAVIQKHHVNEKKGNANDEVGANDAVTVSNETFSAIDAACLRDDATMEENVMVKVEIVLLPNMSSAGCVEHPGGLGSFKISWITTQTHCRCCNWKTNVEFMFVTDPNKLIVLVDSSSDSGQKRCLRKRTSEDVPIMTGNLRCHICSIVFNVSCLSSLSCMCLFSIKHASSDRFSFAACNRFCAMRVSDS